MLGVKKALWAGAPHLVPTVLGKHHSFVVGIKLVELEQLYHLSCPGSINQSHCCARWKSLIMVAFPLMKIIVYDDNHCTCIKLWSWSVEHNITKTLNTDDQKQKNLRYSKHLYIYKNINTVIWKMEDYTIMMLRISLIPTQMVVLLWSYGMSKF